MEKANRTFIDKLGRLLYWGPPWETDPKKRTISYADNVWRTSLYGLSKFFKLRTAKPRIADEQLALRKELDMCVESVRKCYDPITNKFSRHPDHDKDDFSRDQWVMANIFLSVVYDYAYTKLLPFKWRLSKRYFSTIDLWIWYKLISRETFSKIWFWFYSITTRIGLKLYMLRWWIFDNIWHSKKTVRPEYYGFHLMAWQFFAIANRWGIDGKTKVAKALIDYLDYTNDRAKGKNGLLEMLICLDHTWAEPLNHKNISGFPFQNMLPWQNINLHSHHEYSKAYFITLDEKEIWLANDIYTSMYNYLTYWK